MLPQMDGTRTVADIVVDHLEGTRRSRRERVTDLVTFLLREGSSIRGGPTSRLDPRTPSGEASTDRLVAFAKTLSLEWSGADRHVRWWYRTLLRPLFSRTGAVVAVVVAVAGLAAFVVVQTSGRYSIGEATLPSTPLILSLGFVLTYAHELGHALALVHFGRRMKGAGFMLYFGSPAFFVDASDGLMLERGPRILQSAAGPFAEIVLAGCAASCSSYSGMRRFAPLLYKFTVLNYFVIFENLIPLLELDGYFILAEAIEVPDLRERSLQFIQHDLWHKIRGRERLSKQEIGLGRSAFGDRLHGLLSSRWRSSSGSDLRGPLASPLERGAGSRLLLSR